MYKKINVSKINLTALVLFCIGTLLIYFSKLSVLKTNDDMAIMLDLQSLNDASFINLGLSKILTAFYIVKPDIKWYSLSLLVFQGFTIFYIGIQFFRNIRISKKLTIVVISISFFFFCVQLSYNYLAILAAVAAFFSVWDDKKFNFKTETVLFLVIGCFYRIELFLISTIVLGGYSLLVFEKWRDVFKWVITIIASVVFSFSVNVVTQKFLANNEFKAFSAFNKIRGDFHGFPILDDVLISKSYEKVGWTAHDLKDFGEWFFINEVKFNTDKLNELKEVTLSMKSPRLKSKLDFKRGFENKKLKYFIFFVLIFCALFYRNKNAIISSLSIALFVLILEFFFRAPDRLLVPLYATFLVPLYWSFSNNSRALSSLYAFLFMFYCFYKFIPDFKESIAQADETREFVTELEKLPLAKNDVAFDHVFAFIYSSYAFDPYVRYGELVPHGWRIFSPRYYQNLRAENLLRFNQKVAQGELNIVVIATTGWLNFDDKLLRFFSVSDYCFESESHKNFIVKRFKPCSKVAN